MDSAEHSMDRNHQGPAGPDRAKVLILVPQTEKGPAIRSRLANGGIDCSLATAIGDAERQIAHDLIDVVIVHEDLPNEAMRLAQYVEQCRTSARVILLAPRCTVETALQAMRAGVVDLITAGQLDDEFLLRIECAALRARVDRRRKVTLSLLRGANRRLEAQKLGLNRQIETLCRDLADAHGQVSNEMTDVAMASEFKALLSQELDLESLLRTALEYLLSKTGPTNAAVFLPDVDGCYSLGAYVNYNCHREEADVVLDHLCEVVCPHMESEPEIVIFDDADELADWLGNDAAFLYHSQVVAFRCAHEGECLAVMVLFRDRDQPFAPNLPAIIDTLRSVFARQVASVINIHHRARPHWPREAAEDSWDDDGYGFGLAA